MNTKKYKGKWGLIGVNKKQLKKIYSGNRQKAYIILKEKHKEEYTFILSELMHNEYLRRRELKGGYKE
jgi:hypothetical protein